MYIIGCMDQKPLKLYKIRKRQIESKQAVSWNPKVVNYCLSLSLSLLISLEPHALAPLLLSAGLSCAPVS